MPEGRRPAWFPHHPRGGGQYMSVNDPLRTLKTSLQPLPGSRLLPVKGFANGFAHNLNLKLNLIMSRFALLISASMR